MVFTLVTIAGSLAFFLYGMKLMSEGIQKVAGERLHSILSFMTTNKFAGVLTGFLITALIQSSSATTVLVVSFVNAGLLTLKQSIGVIMGASIGTTVTGWIVSVFGFKFDITAIALPAIGIGFPFIFSRKHRFRDIGEVFVGLGILFLGLKFLKESVPEIDPAALEFLTQFTHKGYFSIVFFIFVGTVLTMIVQSSSAAMAITITMAFIGWIDFPTAAAIVLGENIGTTITAFLASLKTSVDARRAARIHTFFKIVGVLWMLFVFPLFINFIDFIVPGDSAIPENIPIHLSMFHTLFNVTNTFIFIWFIPLLVKIAEKLGHEGAKEKDSRYRLDYFKTSIQDTPELNIMQAKNELSKMAGIIESMFCVFLKVFHNPDRKMRDLVDKAREEEDLTDQMQVEISAFLAECAKENLNETSVNNVTAMLRIAHELESIGDSCFNLMIIAQRRYDKKVKLDKESLSEIDEYSKLVKNFISFINEHLNEHMSKYDLDKAYEFENKMDQSRNVLKRNARKRLQKGADVKAQLMFIDIIRHFEQIGDYSLNISQALRQIT
ncbi:MAG: Na/Pi cotransporter family protein [Spirochaetales bacterium]|nr:Na/Pi cotransporter family protein [Spirochaetales bacterium]